MDWSPYGTKPAYTELDPIAIERQNETTRLFVFMVELVVKATQMPTDLFLANRPVNINNITT